ncbi:hypothetical protein SLS62_008959 [Diatrype stigma]|uniref:PH domain-containing protein n=1 Tax=Diatrype stigma TaxID=117547 RepID=A0AAN9UHA2_9PEZI
MDAWLATLRKAIQSLGGKKKLSETGKVDAEDDSAESKLRENRRTLVVRDPKRFSQILPGEPSVTPETSPIDAPDVGMGGPQPPIVYDVCRTKDYVHVFRIFPGKLANSSKLLKQQR